MRIYSHRLRLLTGRGCYSIWCYPNPGLLTVWITVGISVADSYSGHIRTRQELWGWAAGSCVLTSLTRNSNTGSSLRSTALIHIVSLISHKHHGHLFVCSKQLQQDASSFAENLSCFQTCQVPQKLQWATRPYWLAHSFTLRRMFWIHSHRQKTNVRLYLVYLGKWQAKKFPWTVWTPGVILSQGLRGCNSKVSLRKTSHLEIQGGQKQCRERHQRSRLDL